MSWTTTINGVSYTAPDVGENFWGTQVKNWMQAVGGTGSGQGGMLKKDGGLFQVLAEVNFGTAFGIKALTYTSGSANSGSAAGAGQIRLKRADLIDWRNNADSGNLTLGVSTSNWLQWQSVDLADISSAQTFTNKSISGLTNTISNIAISSIVAPAAGVIYSDGASILSETRLSLSRMAAGTQYYLLTGNGASSPSYALLTNNSVDAAAAIARNKLASGTADHVLINDGSGVMSSEARLSLSRMSDGTINYVLIAAGAGVSPAYGLISNSSIDAAAAIARTKIAAGSANHVIINDGSGNLSSEAQLSVSRGGTGLSAVGTSNQILGVNNAANANEYKTLSVGTSGSDFAIAHSAGSVVFNLPDASAAARGALTSTDWSTFNSKIGGSGTNGQVALFSGTSTVTSNSAIQYSTSANSNTLDLLSGIKIGTNTTVAATAGAGAIRYNAGTLEFSDGAAWNTLGVVGAGIVSLNALTATTQTFAVGTAGTDFAISSATSTHTFNLPDAGASARGVVTTGAQTLAGVKTFSSNAVFSSYMTVGDIISRDNSDGSVSVSSGQTLWHPNLDIQTGHTYSIAGQMVLVDELTGAGTVDGDGTVFDTSTDLTGYSRLAANESVTGQKVFSEAVTTLKGFNSFDTTFGSIIGGDKKQTFINIPQSLQIAYTAADTARGLSVFRYSASAVGATLTIGKSRNANLGIMTYAGSGDGIGNIVFGLANEANNYFSQGPTITCSASEAHTASSLGSSLTFSTITNGSTSPVVALTLGQDKSATFAGNIIIGTAGNGIDFGATSNAAGMTSEVLSDYEEGNWTPANGATSYFTQTGRYTKVGNIVTIWGTLHVNTIGAGSATTISGLPFTCGTVEGGGNVDYWGTLAFNAIAVTNVVAASGTTMSFNYSAAAGTSNNLTGAIITSATFLRFHAIYRV